MPFCFNLLTISCVLLYWLKVHVDFCFGIWCDFCFILNSADAVSVFSVFWVYLWSKVGFSLLSLFTWCAKFKLNSNKFALFVFISPIADLLYFYISLYIIATNRKINTLHVSRLGLIIWNVNIVSRCVRVCVCVCVGCTRSNRIVSFVCKYLLLFSIIIMLVFCVLNLVCFFVYILFS